MGRRTERLFYTCICRDDHPEVVLSSMQSIMIVLLEESEDIQEKLLLILLSKFGRNRSVSISDVGCYYYSLGFSAVLFNRPLIIWIYDGRTLEMLREDLL